jgi:hypothetical protein
LFDRAEELRGRELVIVNNASSYRPGRTEVLEPSLPCSLGRTKGRYLGRAEGRLAVNVVARRMSRIDSKKKEMRLGVMN